MLFSYNDYRNYLFEKLGGKGRLGLKGSLAKYLGCNSSHISQVLKGKNELSLEHAYKVNKFLGHNPIQSDYFLTLVLADSVGSKELSNYYTEKIDVIKKNHAILSKRMKSEKSTELNKNDLAVYFSHSIYSLCHLACSLPIIKNEYDLSNYLRFDIEEISKATTFLKDKKIIFEDEINGLTVSNDIFIHIDKSSPFLKNHHTNSRELASKKILEKIDSTNIHYAAFSNMSEKLFDLTKEDILNLLEQFKKRIPESKKEITVGIVIDFYKY